MTVSCPANIHLLGRNSLMNKIEFLRPIPQWGNARSLVRTTPLQQILSLNLGTQTLLSKCCAKSFNIARYKNVHYKKYDNISIYYLLYIHIKTRTGCFLPCYKTQQKGWTLQKSCVLPSQNLWHVLLQNLWHVLLQTFIMHMTYTNIIHHYNAVQKLHKHVASYTQITLSHSICIWKNVLLWLCLCCSPVGMRIGLLLT